MTEALSLKVKRLASKNVIAECMLECIGIVLNAKQKFLLVLGNYRGYLRVCPCLGSRFQVRRRNTEYFLTKVEKTYRCWACYLCEGGTQGGTVLEMQNI